MKMRKTILCLLIGIIFAACSNEDIPTTDSSEEWIPLVVNASQVSVTRVHDAKWENGDAIGITVYNEDAHQSVVVNRKYIISSVANGTFVPETKDATLGDQTILLKKGTKYTVYAYYPWTNQVVKDNEKFYVKLDLSNQSDLSKLDVLRAETSTTMDGKSIALNFSHALMKVILNISNGKNVASQDLIGLTAVVTLQVKNPMLDLSTCSIAKSFFFQDEIMMKTSSDGTKAEVILNPEQTLDTGFKFKLLNGKQFSCLTIEFDSNGGDFRSWNVNCQYIANVILGR